MENPHMWQAVPAWIPGSLTVAWLTRELLGMLRERRRVRTETDANVELIGSMRDAIRHNDERLQRLEQTQEALRAELEGERERRRVTEEREHRLMLRVMRLEDRLRRLGAVVPEEA